MLDAHPGGFVYAVAGRDSGKCFIILSVEDNYAYIADGKGRKVGAPKKKKLKHLCLTSSVDPFLANKLFEVGKVTNKEVRHAIRAFLGENK
ncbi:MAG: KOW domain-containing RNA-binding protein [Clostridia bacterium]|nr:KOW domain-containing RNA-binding protein [Clostridia bacterium]